jgi:hypothetical protein
VLIGNLNDIIFFYEEKMDPKSGKIYYANKIEKRSQWERPT